MPLMLWCRWVCEVLLHLLLRLLQLLCEGGNHLPQLGVLSPPISICLGLLSCSRGVSLQLPGPGAYALMLCTEILDGHGVAL